MVASNDGCGECPACTIRKFEAALRDLHAHAFELQDHTEDFVLTPGMLDADDLDSFQWVLRLVQSMTVVAEERITCLTGVSCAVSDEDDDDD